MVDTTTSQIQPLRLFLSYCSGDRDPADRLRASLEAERCRVWMAPGSIEGHVSWAEQIVAAVESAAAVVVLLSPSAMASTHVAREVSLAIDAGTPVIPVRLSETPLTGSLRYLLELSQWLDAFDAPVESLASAIVSRAERPDGPVLREPAAPVYPATTRAPAEIAPGTLRGADEVYEVTGAGLRVGRTPDNDLVLTDPDVSRHHCTISAAEDGFVLTDLHSTNGTRVNGRLIDHHLLADGDRLRLGSTELVFGWPG